MTVPSHLSQALLAENQRLKTLQRVYELHRRLLEVLDDPHVVNEDECFVPKMFTLFLS